VTLTVTAAQAQDEPLIRQLHAEAVAWLSEQGTDQWQPSAMRTHPPAERTLAASIGRGEVFLMREDDRVVGTLMLDDYADPDFWTADDDPGSALYVHRMIVTREASGRDLGGAMLDWAAKQAARTGRAWLRLDAWRTNLALHRYYERHGFIRVRTVDLPHRGSGALYQRPAHALLPN
jgi:GNAT superfamily N-acetyltransferase